MANKWAKFTVKYSMNRFLETGGGLLLIQVKGKPIIVIISNKSYILQPKKNPQKLESKK